MKYKKGLAGIQQDHVEVTLADGSSAYPAPVVIVDPSNGLGVLGDAPVASLDDNYTTANYVYSCDAAPGSLTSAAVWRISRLNLTTGQTQWADSGNFSQIADNRASLTYL